jgi:hypothetical protein
VHSRVGWINRFEGKGLQREPKSEVLCRFFSCNTKFTKQHNTDGVCVCVCVCLHHPSPVTVNTSSHSWPCRDLNTSIHVRSRCDLDTPHGGSSSLSQNCAKTVELSLHPPLRIACNIAAPLETKNGQQSTHCPSPLLCIAHATRICAFGSHHAP